MSTPTLKRYWNAEKPEFRSKEEKDEWETFDAKLTPRDVFEMQCIDADCNDCIHFKRGKMNKCPGLVTFSGVCGKDGTETTAYPGQYTGRECFEHRKVKLMGAT